MATPFLAGRVVVVVHCPQVAFRLRAAVALASSLAYVIEPCGLLVLEG